MAWTSEQQLAIDKTGTNIIVSAGAGSGKTAVLSERVLKKVLNGVSVDSLLILTFTRLAAQEMKDRIRKKIKDNNLIDQLNKLDNAYITTFDSYALSVVKKYHYTLGVSKNVNIIDENIINIKINEILDSIIDEYYSNPTKEFNKFMDAFCIKDDSVLKNTILKLNHILDMKYDKEDYLTNYIDNFYNLEFIQYNINEIIRLIRIKIKELDILVNDLSNCIDIDYLNSINTCLEGLFNCRDYDDYKYYFDSYKFPSKPRNCEVGEGFEIIRDRVKDKIDEIKSLIKYDSVSSMKESIYITKDYIKLIIEIINKLDDKLNKYKYSNNLFTFNDIAKMSIKIVKDNPDILHEIKYSFSEILLDEYQDTNDLQEEFISLISNHNVYSVGDIKQSIYRFRNANPNIFKEKYNKYANLEDGIKIDLLKNFRSREEVLNNINLIFDSLMDLNIGGADYTVSHRMNFGNTDYLKDDTKQDYNMEILTYDKEEIKEKNIKPLLVEINTIADDIINKVNNKYKIFDKDTKEVRDCNYSDFAIILDRGSNFDDYKKIFTYKNIPINVYNDEVLTNSSILMVIKNIFKLLSNIKNNGIKEEYVYCYLSIARSFLFRLDDNYIFNTIKINDYSRDIIISKINIILNNIESKTISNILDEIIEEFDIYNKITTLINVKEEFIKLDYLRELSSNLNTMGYDYNDFYLLIDDIINNENSEIKYSLNKEASNSVKLLNIHKSKGLEYPICYFAGLSKGFNNRDMNDNFVFDNKLGIITPIFNEGLDNTFYKDLYCNNYKIEDIGEKIRLFYVALTRAREKMIFVSPSFDDNNFYDERGVVFYSERINYRNFYDMLNSVSDKLVDYIKKIDLDKIDTSNNYLLGRKINIKYEDGEKINTLKYNEKNKELIEKAHFSKGNNLLLDIETVNKLDFGTKLHYYLENIDFKNPDYSLIEDEYVDYVKAFINNDIFGNYEKASIYKELEFIDTVDNKEMNGVIDLMIEYDDIIYIVDYKTKNIEDIHYNEQVLGYKNYISKIKNKEIKCYLYSIIEKRFKEIF